MGARFFARRKRSHFLYLNRPVSENLVCVNSKNVAAKTHQTCRSLYKLFFYAKKSNFRREFCYFLKKYQVCFAQKNLFGANFKPFSKHMKSRSPERSTEKKRLVFIKCCLSSDFDSSDASLSNYQGMWFSFLDASLSNLTTMFCHAIKMEILCFYNFFLRWSHSLSLPSLKKKTEFLEDSCKICKFL